MDYDDRDDIGTWLLKLFSLLALLTAIAGIILYGLIPRRANSRVVFPVFLWLLQGAFSKAGLPTSPSVLVPSHCSLEYPAPGYP